MKTYSSNKSFKDCFNNSVYLGDDILIAEIDEDRHPIIYCGIVYEITDSWVEYSIQHWVNDEEIITNIRRDFKNNDKRFKNIYKIKY